MLFPPGPNLRRFIAVKLENEVLVSDLTVFRASGYALDAGGVELAATIADVNHGWLTHGSPPGAFP
jgi:hypothetical protein